MKALTKPEAVAILNSFIKQQLPTYPWFTKIAPELKAMILYGSTAKGTNRPDSDIDLLFVLPLEIEEQHTAGEYFFELEGRSINIVIRSIERLRKIAEAHNDPVQTEVFRGAKILWQKDSEVQELITAISPA